MQRKIYVFLFDGYSDWELGYVTPELNKSDSFEVVYFSEGAKPVTSMGGLTVQPSRRLENLSTENVSMLILPGGEFWERNENALIKIFIKDLVEKQVPIAAICAATTALASISVLDDIKHTSNDLGYLKKVVPGYKGYHKYQKNLAVRDHHFITANGTAPIEFAKEIFTELQLYPGDLIDQWYQLFKYGNLDA